MDWLVLSILLGLCSFAAGWLGSVAHDWALGRRLTELEYRLEDQEGRLLRETKIRAGTMGRIAKENDERLTEWAQERLSEGNQGVGQGQLDFKSWRASKFRS